MPIGELPGCFCSRPSFRKIDGRGAGRGEAGLGERKRSQETGCQEIGSALLSRSFVRRRIRVCKIARAQGEDCESRQDVVYIVRLLLLLSYSPAASTAMATNL